MNVLGSIIVTGLIGVSIYSILVLIAISTGGQDFLWTLGFVIQLTQDFFIVDPLMCLVKLISVFYIHSDLNPDSLLRKILFMFY
jgi:hypothetical protein